MNSRSLQMLAAGGVLTALASIAMADQWICPVASISAHSSFGGRMIRNVGQPLVGRSIDGTSGGDSLVLHAGAIPCYRVRLVADLNGDGEVNLADYALLVGCLTGPDQVDVSVDCASTELNRADVDGDDDVDLKDFAEMAREF